MLRTKLVSIIVATFLMTLIWTLPAVYADHCKGNHANDPLCSPPPPEPELPKLIMLIEDKMVPGNQEFRSEVFSTEAANSLTLLGISNGLGLTIELRFFDRVPAGSAMWNQPNVAKVIGAFCIHQEVAIGDCRRNAGTTSPLLPSNSIQVGGPYAQMRISNSSSTDIDFNISVYLR